MCVTNITSSPPKPSTRLSHKNILNMKKSKPRTLMPLISYFNMFADVTVYPLVLAASRPLSLSVMNDASYKTAF